MIAERARRVGPLQLEQLVPGGDLAQRREVAARADRQAQDGGFPQTLSATNGSVVQASVAGLSPLQSRVQVSPSRSGRNSSTVSMRPCRRMVCSSNSALTRPTGAARFWTWSACTTCARGTPAIHAARSTALCDKRPLYPGFRGYTAYA